MAAHEDPLASYLTFSIDLTKNMLPDWTPPDLNQPYANPEPYEGGYAMLGELKPGAQIMVNNPSGYRHHGIFVGQQVVTPGKRAVPAVVDVWGFPSKEHATISLRSYEDFVADGTSFAEALYPPGAALDQTHSALIAIELAKNAKGVTFVYNAAFNNCEHFATMCRCLRCATRNRACHDTLDTLFSHLPPAPPRRKDSHKINAISSDTVQALPSLDPPIINDSCWRNADPANRASYRAVFGIDDPMDFIIKN